MESSHRKKLVRFNEPGHAHELTFSCHQRLPLLSRDRTRSWLIEAIDRARRELNFSVLAYVIMPEHVHLLVLPREPVYSISSFLKRVKQSVSRRARAWLAQDNPAWLEKLTIDQKDGRQEFRFWMAGGGYDRNVTDLKTLRTMIAYIHNNPVRKELVQKPSDWKYSSAGWYEERKPGPLELDSWEE
jgi:putative transposase